MSFNLLKYREKRIRAKTDIAYGRLVLHGPRFEKFLPGMPVGQGVDVRDPNLAQQCKFSGTSYSTRKYRDAQEADVSQEVAEHLCVKANLAELISGGWFSGTEQSDGLHLVEIWIKRPWWPPNALFQPIEKVELITQSPMLLYC